MQFSKRKQHLNNASDSVLVLYWAGLNPLEGQMEVLILLSSRLLQLQIITSLSFFLFSNNQFLMCGVAALICDFKFQSLKASWPRDPLILFPRKHVEQERENSEHFYESLPFLLICIRARARITWIPL